ncbi:Acetoacetyl-CoA synthase [Taphrina deformans PYCC 5710]|uniref:Acetoacetyl-CoA synthase n=1 Tax=Taphrina deformans (strain PYCC 5710 / ATCC 11124 / CBS 356.35 / IMI 108563 / JCM 9778 / NBRC 8474) TaxID=1097556 RepID=R4XBT9_TAPDE|nr:Acetoacetyl-CoA synthase [Taphrina deformans PYCC 5710]|eukprot:CCG83330.1 Acetoacetyl-CoA synthase [Taphrina deformans PYCC 5710]
MSVVWRPKAGDADVTQIHKFMAYVNRQRDRRLHTYDELYEYSISEDSFWIDLSDFLEIQYSTPPTNTLAGNIKLCECPLYPPPQFFPGARLNYAENCLEGKNAHQTAVIMAREGATQVERYSFAQLKTRVHRLADALRSAGVRKGDRVAGILANSIYAVTLVLATASIGAVYSSTATDMGISGILDRLRQIVPKVVFFDNASFYNNKSHELLSKAESVLSSIDSNDLAAFVVAPNMETMASKIGHGKACTLDELYEKHPGRSHELKYEQVEFTHPLFVMYSSGTTGPPKCIVHSVGGVLLQMRKEYALQCDMHAGDIYWQYTTTGWMMYNYLLTSLAAGVTIVCLDGSPMVNIPGLIKFMEAEKITHYGTSPRWLSELKTQNINPKDLAALESLRCVTSTGSVLVEALFHQFYKSWPTHIQLASVSGGTDLMSCFFMHNVITPVYAGQLQCVALGMAARVFDAAGKDISEPGRPGELVCTRPFPSQPIYFLSDPDGGKYKSAYYETYPGIWHHSDFVQFEASGGVTMLGRSDGVLNPSGVRFGSAEIYSITEKFPEIVDALCVGQRRPTDADETVLLFIITKSKAGFTTELVDRIKRTIQRELSPRHGKSLRRSGESPKVSATIANPEVLEYYRQFVNIEGVVRKDQARL